MLRSVFYFLLLLITVDSVIFDVCYINKTEIDPPLSVPTPIKTMGKTFIIETSFLASWYKAEQFCRLHGMNLASINSQEEDKKLGEAMLGSGLNKFKFWTSGNDLDYYSSYVWQSTGNSFSFTNFRLNEPNHDTSENQIEHCIVVHNYAAGGWWNDCICSSQLFFICEV